MNPVEAERLRRAREMGSYQFRELYSRSAKENRFDVTVLSGAVWMGATGQHRILE